MKTLFKEIIIGRFSIIEIFACIIDLILNPSAIDYPIADYIGDNIINNYPKGYLFTIYFKNKRLVYVRWI